MRKPIQLVKYAGIGTMMVALLMAKNVYGADDPGELVFVQKIVDSINRKDDDARRSLMHPDALACTHVQKKAMAEGAYVPKWNPIPAHYRWQISPMSADMSGWFSDKFDYPVRPTHQLQIDFDSAPTRSQSIVLQIIRYGNEWREVTGCPKASTVAEAKAAAKARGQQEEKIRKLAETIAPKLKMEVQQQLVEGRKVDAIMHYRDVMNEDLVVAKGVIELLLKESEGRNGHWEK